MIEPEECSDFAAALAAAGWAKDRKVETTAAVAAWSELGYTISGAALSFVANFNGIILQYPQTFPEATGRFDTRILNAARATGAIIESTVPSYEDRIQDALCPVGVAASGHLVLLASSSGRAFGGYDSFLALYGDNGYEALCRIFNRTKGPPIPSL